MAIDTSSMDALLAKINTVRESMQASLQPAAGAKTGPVDFAAALKASIDRVDSAQASAETMAQQFQLGDSTVTLEETMLSIAKANLSFQQMVQVRNRMVAAYHEIMNMQV